MSKNKLKKFEEVAGMNHVLQPEFDEIFNKSYKLKGKWAGSFFKNNNPVVLELGCGKGEYTVGLAQKYPEKNFIGIDIKGARIWKGAKQSLELGLKNVGFIRTRIELIESFFAQAEVNEIWLTFPDPQLKKARNKKRLSGPGFLNKYRSFLIDNGLIHLKTDNTVLYEYTHQIAHHNKLPIEISTPDLYGSGIVDDILSIQTFYEAQYREQGMKINYLRFKLPNDKHIEGLPE
ncbi:MAG: tRNA (guanosine(46)-N7)-methyltransferase TrmB [Bacteroidota bacterium]